MISRGRLSELIQGAIAGTIDDRDSKTMVQELMAKHRLERGLRDEAEKIVLAAYIRYGDSQKEERQMRISDDLASVKRLSILANLS